MTQLMARPGALSDDSEDALDSALPHEKLCDYANTVFVGTNLLFPGNKREHLAFLNDEYSKVISSQAVAAHPEGQAQEALQHLEWNQIEAVWVHLDIGSIDPGGFLLANVPNFMGVPFQSMMQTLKVFMDSANFVGFSVARVKPDHDSYLIMMMMLTKERLCICLRNENVSTHPG
jgi:arginase